MNEQVEQIVEELIKKSEAGLATWVRAGKSGYRISHGNKSVKISHYVALGERYRISLFDSDRCICCAMFRYGESPEYYLSLFKRLYEAASKGVEQSPIPQKPPE
jgi:hypothetical protein